MKWRFWNVMGIFAWLIMTAGCGSNGGGSTSDSVTVAAASCISCHDPVISPVTGLNIVTEWQASTHSTQNAASCHDCHEPDPSHPSNCNLCHGGGTLSTDSARHDVSTNPDADRNCDKCHAETATISPLGAGENHYDAPISADLLGSNVEEATYVGAQNTNNCRGCHNPHDSRLLPQHTAWSASGHGDTTATPWRHYSYNTQSGGSCNRCHTTTGFLSYLASGTTASFGLSSDRHELLRCDGCHLDYSWKRRDGKTIGYAGVKVPYPSFTDTTVVFPDAGNSNLCTNCHSGRVSGKQIANATTIPSNFGTYNSHYFAAGGNLYAQVGYEYRSHDDYLLVSGNNIFEHSQIGINDTTWVGGSPSHVINLGTTRGPCVGCHMFNKSHALASVTFSGSPATTREKINATIDSFPAFTEVCFKCHTPGGPYADDLSFGGAADIRTLKVEYKTRLAELEAALQSLPNSVKIYYNPDKYPYFFSNSTFTSNFGNWNAPYPGQWKHTLGAAFNLNLCFRDPGGYVHNHRYTERLIYDSLDFLDDGDPTNGSYVSAGFLTGRPL